MKAIKSALLGAALLAATVASAQNEQFVPVLSYRVGPSAAGGSGYYGGAIDYWTLTNMNGGVNGSWPSRADACGHNLKIVAQVSVKLKPPMRY